MANPYHDETGKFCSKQKMAAAIGRMHAAGDFARRDQLTKEYQEIQASEPPRSQHEMTDAEWDAAPPGTFRTRNGITAMKLSPESVEKRKQLMRERSAKTANQIAEEIREERRQRESVAIKSFFRPRRKR